MNDAVLAPSYASWSFCKWATKILWCGSALFVATTRMWAMTFDELDVKLIRDDDAWIVNYS